jgi:hypothetical protein
VNGRDQNSIRVDLAGECADLLSCSMRKRSVSLGLHLTRDACRSRSSAGWC